MNKTNRDTVGVYLKPHTRDRLNKFIADTRLATGQFMSQSSAVDTLLDYYLAAHAKPTERALEPMRS